MVTTGAGANYFLDEFSSGAVGTLFRLVIKRLTCADSQNIGAEAAQLPVADTGDDDQLALGGRHGLGDRHEVFSVKTQ